VSATAPFRTRGLHHQGITVSDLDRSVRFYSEVFGATVDWEIEASGEGISELTRVPEADIRVALLRLPYGNIELFEYRNPDGRPYELRSNDVGAAHLCLEVDDVEAAYDRLQELGVTCRFPPQVAESGRIAGYRYFYFDDPDGLPVELLQLPER
jgi:catechol 2,3-dioxygenase-like lactoylglutathione lyase family enzyme